MSTEKQEHGTSQARTLRRSLLAPFVKDRSGSTAIEFILLILPFSAVLFAILESCLSFAAQQHMQNVVDTIARQYRVGQIKAADKTAGEIKTMVCERMEIFVAKGCPGLEINFQTKPTFSDIAKIKTKYKDNDIDTTEFVIKPGTAETKNFLHIYYRWPVMTDILRKYMSPFGTGIVFHFAGATWQNEPFDD